MLQYRVFALAQRVIHFFKSARRMKFLRAAPLNSPQIGLSALKLYNFDF